MLWNDLHTHTNYYIINSNIFHIKCCSCFLSKAADEVYENQIQTNTCISKVQGFFYMSIFILKCLFCDNYKTIGIQIVITLTSVVYCTNTNHQISITFRIFPAITQYTFNIILTTVANIDPWFNMKKKTRQ
jgi:hypothetical protein